VVLSRQLQTSGLTLCGMLPLVVKGILEHRSSLAPPTTANAPLSSRQNMSSQNIDVTQVFLVLGSWTEADKYLARAFRIRPMLEDARVASER
jgi:hypothetical protein